MRTRLTSVLLILLALPGLGFQWEGRLARLRRELSDEDPARRREVVELLSSYPASEVRDALLGALEDPDAGVRAQAADAVGRVRVREAVPRLLDWLDDPDPDVRAAAARALGAIGETRAIDNLVRVLGDSNADVRRAAVGALAGIGGDPIVVPLLGRLDDVDPRVRVDAARVLGRLGDARAAVPLVGRARDDAPEVRAAVYAALGDLADQRAVPALVQGLRDGAAEPKLAAIAALGRIGSTDAVRPLVAVLSDDDARTSTAVIAALGRIRDPIARRALVEALARPRTRGMASQTLVERARRSARSDRSQDADSIVEHITHALDAAEEPAHATELAQTLTRISSFHPIESATPSLLAALRGGRGAPPTVLRALGATGSPDALMPLLERVRSDEVPVRLAVLEALGRHFDRATPDGRAADPLLAALGEVTEPERVPVVQLLGRVRARRTLPALRALLTHRDADLRFAAIQAIGEIGGPDGASAVSALLDDRDPRLRFEAARALGGSASPDDVTGLLARAMSREPTDRHALLIALAGALPRLETAGELPEATRADALETLHRLWMSDDQTLTARSLDVLTAWHPTEATPALTRSLAGAPPSRARSIARALGAIDSNEARAALRELMDRPSVTLRTQVASVMGEHGGAAEAALLLERGPDLPWPASASAAFALARLARRGVLQLDEAHEGLCRMAASHDPSVRANVATTMAALAAPPCPSGVHPLGWLDPAHASIVRSAAARWARASADADHAGRAAVDEALSRCAEAPLTPDVASVCAHPELPPLETQTDLYAYGTDQTTLLASRLIGLRLADGSVWVTHADANGHLRLEAIPAGALVLEDPGATPLEP